MHPHLAGAFAAEHQARMLASARAARAARHARSGHRSAHVMTVLGRWARRFAMWRTRPLPIARILPQRARPAGPAPTT